MSTLVGGMISICCHMALVLAFMYLYSIFNLQLILSIRFFFFFKSGIETPDRNGQWYQHLLNLFAIFFTRAIPKGITFGICFLCLYHVICMFCIVFDLCEI